MVFNRKRSGNRRSNRRSIPRNNINRNSVDLMQLVRSHARYHPYVFDSNFSPMTTSRRSQSGFLNTRHDMNQFYRSVYGELSPDSNVSHTESRGDMGTNTSTTYFDALAQTQESPTPATATHSGNTENAKETDQNKIDDVNKDQNAASSPHEEAQPSLASPQSQTSSKSSINEVPTTDESSLSFIEERSSVGLHKKPNTLTTESSSDFQKTFQPLIFPDLMPTQNSAENSGSSDSTIEIVPEEDVPQQNTLIAADEEAGGDGEHNNSLIEIEITFTATNVSNAEEDEYEGGDEES